MPRRRRFATVDLDEISHLIAQDEGAEPDNCFTNDVKAADIRREPATENGNALSPYQKRPTKQAR